MHVVTDLTASDFLAVQVRSIHALRGTYYHPYHETRMDTRTIIDVTPSATAGRFDMHLSDGSTATVGDFIDSPEGIRVEIRAADGSLTGDGPLLTDEIRAKFVAFAVENIPTHTAPIVIPPAATSPTAPEPPAAPTSSTGSTGSTTSTSTEVQAEATGSGTSSGDAPDAAPVLAHAGHASVLRELADKINRGVTVFVHDIEAALHAVL